MLFLSFWILLFFNVLRIFSSLGFDHLLIAMDYLTFCVVLQTAEIQDGYC